MITQLIATFMISTGVALTSTPVLSKETKPNLLNAEGNNEINQFTLSPTRDGLGVSTEAVGADGAEQRNITHYRNRWKGYNNALYLESYLYISTAKSTQTEYEDNQEYTKTYFNIGAPSNYQQTDDYTKDYQVTNALFCAKVTPYKYLSDVQSNISLKFSNSMYLVLNSITQQNAIQVKIKVDTYTLTTSDVDRFIGSASWNTTYFNYDVMKEITSSQNGYTFNSNTQTLTYNVNGTENANTYVTLDVNIEEDWEILPETDNYMFMMLTPYLVYNDGFIVNIINETNTGAPTYGHWIAPLEAYSNQKSVTFTGWAYTPVQDYEVIDIPGFLFSILTMPFSFISTAFNLTLFPGTPYQINLANIFLAIIGVLVFIFLLRIFMKNKIGG